MTDFDVTERGGLQEIRLARALGRVIETELQKGTELPDEVKRAYLELYAHWQYQMNKEMT
jgi:hypothetical protein